MERIRNIISALGVSLNVFAAEPFRTEEDGTAYQVWKLTTDRGAMVLKKTTAKERAVYETFFADGGPVPEVYAFGTCEGETWMLMEFVPGQTMSRCTRKRLVAALDALMGCQEKWWGNETHTHVGCGYSDSLPKLKKRTPYMGDLEDAYLAFLDEYENTPRTLCNDDMLPFNVLATDDRAVILDWEYGGILPYASSLARFLAFGEEEGEMFQMSDEDRDFALSYYYENLISTRGISRAEFDRTMALFFFKEYSEWVYCAGVSGDFEMEYYKKYGKMAKNLALSLGLMKEKGGAEC